MYQYHNYAYSSGVPNHQNVAAYSTRQSAAAAAAAAAAASNNPVMSTSLAADDAGTRRVNEAAAERDLASKVTAPSCRRAAPGGATSSLDRLSADSVPPPPSTSRPRDGLTSPSARPAHLSNPPAPAGVRDCAPLYSSPLSRVAVHVDADDNDDDGLQQHARSHSAPAAPRHRPAAADHRRSGPPSCSSPPMWYVRTMSPSENRADAERRLLLSPLPPPSAAASTPRDSTTNVRHRRTFPPADVELNGPVVDVRETDGLTAKRPNSVSLAPASVGCDPVLTRRRLRAARGRLNLYETGDCGFGSTLAGMAIVAGAALVLSVVGVHLLLRLTAASPRSTTVHDDATSETTNVGDSLLPATTSRSDDRSRTTIARTVVEEVAIALAAVTVVLDLCCLLTVSIQCFFAVKLAQCRNAELRFYFYCCAHLCYVRARFSDRKRVPPSVCPSHAGYDSKLMTVGSRGFHHWVVKTLVF